MSLVLKRGIGEKLQAPLNSGNAIRNLEDECFRQKTIKLKSEPADHNHAESAKKYHRIGSGSLRGKIAGLNGAPPRFGIPHSTLDSKIKPLKIRKHNCPPEPQ
jgi:hypothetical protein